MERIDESAPAREATAAASPLNGLTYQIIGCAMSVHNKLGPGLKESAYHHALHAEMTRSGLACQEEVPIEIHLDESAVGLLYLDHLVGGVVVVEDKALLHQLTNEEVAQLVTYLAATNKPVGLLFNFGRPRLEYKRIYPPRDRTQWKNRINRYIWKPRRA
jgi:GxxExxY protein